MEFLTIVIILAVGALWGFICYKIADSRGRNKGLAFALGFFFGLFAVIGYLIAGETSEKKAETFARAMKEAKREK